MECGWMKFDIKERVYKDSVQKTFEEGVRLLLTQAEKINTEELCF
jgi:hypothetical protein